MIENEVKILRKVNHPNIMSLVAEQDTKNLLYLVCEYVAGRYYICYKIHMIVLKTNSYACNCFLKFW